MLFGTYLDLLHLNIVYFVLDNGHFVLEDNISLAVGTMCVDVPKITDSVFSFSRIPCFVNGNMISCGDMLIRIFSVRVTHIKTKLSDH